MIARLRARCDDDGLTLVELMIAAMVASIIAALMLTWLVAVARNEQLVEEEAYSLDELRTAKAQLVKELRFADNIVTTPGTDTHSLDIVVDGDAVTWEIQPDGRLTRTVNSGTPGQRADRLVYDATFGAGSSFFHYDGAEKTVYLEIVSDADDTDDTLNPKAIQTQVRLRNVP